LRGARFNPKGGFGCVYLSGDAVTALAEVEGVFLHRQPRPVLVLCRRVWMVIRVEGLLTRVLDLADPKVQTLLGSSPAELTGPWLGLDRPPTQRLGQAAFDSGRVAALRYGSIKHPDGYNLVVFTDRLASIASDYLEVSEPGMAQRLP
jgi:RES domain-containing protein